MTTIVNPSIFRFLTDLKENNTREWFAKNKDYYLEEEDKIKSFFTSVFQGLSSEDNLEGMKVYRIYRDIRFSKDKTPYKIYRSCGYKRATEALRGGYHLEVTPGGSFLAGGQALVQLFEGMRKTYRLGKKYHQQVDSFLGKK